MAHTAFQLHYQRPSQIQHDLDRTAIQFAPDGQRPPTLFSGKSTHPLAFREAMSALYSMYASDLRHRAQDRTAYLQYLQRQAAQNPGSAKSAAQMKQAQEFIAQRLEDEELQEDIFDPLLSIHPDEAFFEIFSKDESTYAKLSFDWDAFEEVQDLQYGTTHVDFSKEFYDSLQRIRAYKNTQVSIDEHAFEASEETSTSTKELNIPDSWLRGMLQVQSAATLPMTHFQLAPIDLYNILIFLRQNKAKKAPRGLRYELVPGTAPRIILEPWEHCFFGQGPSYEGTSAQIIRTWGRKRLKMLSRLLPYTETIDVYTLGSGLPTFYVLRMQNMTFTMGLSGWTQQNWSANTQFAAMMPQDQNPAEQLKQITDSLQSTWSSSLEHLMEDTQLKKPAALSALQTLCKQGQVMYDLAKDVYRFREVSPVPLDPQRLKHRNQQEERADQLLALSQNSDEPLIQITKFNHLLGQGVEIHGEVEDKEAFRSYQCSFFVDLDGRMSRMKCTSPWFQQTKSKEGPSAYLLALYLVYIQQRAQEEEQRKSGQDRQIIVAETRTLSRRVGNQETLYQLTLDHTQVRVQWGARGQKMRNQKLAFNTSSDARDEYFSRIDRLTYKGYIEAQA